MTVKSVAIVTGASQGIGRATAVRLARDFAAVVLVARNQEELEKTATEARSVGAETLIYALDLRDPRSAEIVVKGSGRPADYDAVAHLCLVISDIPRKGKVAIQTLVR
jgi:3-oxoacyl-[acyl-carrier protein] reductase